MLDSLDDGAGGRCSAGTHRDQRCAFIGAPPFLQRDGDHPTAGTPDPVADVIAAVSEEHTAALWRCAIFLAGDRARAKEMVAETLRRACQHPEIADYSDTSARAWLYSVVRDIITDKRAPNEPLSTAIAERGSVGQPG
jgi:Sigma-70 region 2